MLRALATIAAAVALFAGPGGALAMHAPLGSRHASRPSSAGGTPANLLRDGKYMPNPARDPSVLQVVRVVRPRGFAYRDAGIGAACGALALALLGGIVILPRSRGRERGAPRAPERPPTLGRHSV